MQKTELLIFQLNNSDFYYKFKLLTGVNEP